MSSIGKKTKKQFSNMCMNDLESLLKVCMRDLLDSKVTSKTVSRASIRRQIACILTHLNDL